MSKAFAFIFLLWPALSMAGAITKCVDAGGKITFSQHGCAAGSEQGQVTIKEPPRPSGSGPSVKLAKPSAQSSAQQSAPRARRTFNHCGDLTQVDIAHAKSNGKVILGMTGDDVLEIWGPPAQINQTASGDQWIYPIDERRNRYLYVDPRGCFTYWN